MIAISTWSWQTGLIILFVAAEMFMAKYKHKLIVNNAKKQLEAKEAAK